jgi:hypothetical protein
MRVMLNAPARAQPLAVAQRRRPTASASAPTPQQRRGSGSDAAAPLVRATAPDGAARSPPHAAVLRGARLLASALSFQATTLDAEASAPTHALLPRQERPGGAAPTLHFRTVFISDTHLVRAWCRAAPLHRAHRAAQKKGKACSLRNIPSFGGSVWSTQNAMLPPRAAARRRAPSSPPPPPSRLAAPRFAARVEQVDSVAELSRAKQMLAGHRGLPGERTAGLPARRQLRDYVFVRRHHRRLGAVVQPRLLASGTAREEESVPCVPSHVPRPMHLIAAHER